MADLTDNELRAVAYFSIGVSSEGKDASYRLAFAGNPVRQHLLPECLQQVLLDSLYGRFAQL
ncbi:hypothetical protein [Luteibacter sp. ME-Dv--P-043b]|uniref:hypothetical protein n=1 Tax=Luteibacter sp. ME-Dv--P-043b TaxID=3040291 RepID=UPI002553AD24|nr:hypothetical protein [Luteibacter sp. ME-Dv--P-043b]